MNIEEALAWLRGERSSWSLMNTAVALPEAHTISAQVDAASTEQAYWIVRAHKEGLMEMGDHECQNPYGCRCVVADGRWISVLDDATCEWCSSREGQP